MRHADGREAFLAHAERHVGVGLRGACQGVGEFVVFGGFEVESFAAVDVEREHEDFEFVPGDFALANPERIELHFVLGAFVGLRPFSVSGLPIINLPPGMGTMSNVASVLLMVSV